MNPKLGDSSRVFFTNEEASCLTYILLGLTWTNSLADKKFQLVRQKVSFHSMRQDHPRKFNTEHNFEININQESQIG